MKRPSPDKRLREFLAAQRSPYDLLQELHEATETADRRPDVYCTPGTLDDREGLAERALAWTDLNHDHRMYAIIRDALFGYRAARRGY